MPRARSYIIGNYRGAGGFCQVGQIQDVATVLNSYDLKNHKKVTKVTYHKILKIPSRQVDRTVENLIQTFNSPRHRPLFRKACWRIPENVIYAKTEKALKQGTTPLAYFITSIKNELNH